MIAAERRNVCRDQAAVIPTGAALYHHWSARARSELGIDPFLCMQYFACIVTGQRQVDSFAAAFKALSEPTRLRIMALVCRAGRELCVCELVDALEQPQYHVSRSLGTLRKAGLVAERRAGKWVYYRLPPERDSVDAMALKAVAAIPAAVLAQDLAGLNRRLKLRENGNCCVGVQKSNLLSRRK